MSRDLSVRDFVDGKMTSGGQVRSFLAKIRIGYLQNWDDEAYVFRRGREGSWGIWKATGAEVFGRGRELRCLEGEGS